MRMRLVISMGFLVGSTLLAARSARALQPADTPPAQPSPTASTTESSPPATTAPAQSAPPPTPTASAETAPAPTAPSASASASAPAAPAEGGEGAPSNGFHVAAGVGPSGSDRPGIGGQIRVGWRLTPKWRLFLHSVHQLYPVSSTTVTPRTGGGSEQRSRTDWRDSFLLGPGADYFFLPRVAARASVGLGCDCLIDGRGDNNFGYSFLLGMSFDVLGDGDIRGTIDPYIHKLQFDPGGTNGWTSATVIGATLNFSLR